MRNANYSSARHIVRAGLLLLLCVLQACGAKSTDVQLVDVLIVNGQVYDGSLRPPQTVSIGITGDRIVFIGNHAGSDLRAARTIDAKGKLVAPGFIDPHTHSLTDLQYVETGHNLNYLSQGVTTVIVGNDGGGPANIDEIGSQLTEQGIGSNVGFLTGHGSVRRTVMGNANRVPTQQELNAMQSLLRAAMQQGALGLSSGLFYAPGSFAETTELVELSSEIAQYGGIYDTHIRDESSYTIGLIAAVKEAIEIGRKSGAAVNLSHLKALGVDVWGQSKAVIELVEAARDEGIQITADQYPWDASGTSIKAALIPRDYAGLSSADYPGVLDSLLRDDDFIDLVEDNLRRRGGPASILVTAAENESAVGLSLDEIARQAGATPIATAFDIERNGGARIASFNMSSADIEAFMAQPWVMTSSDGSSGHPRKYATYPMKYQNFVVDKGLLTPAAFIHRSSALVADTFKLRNRGRLKVGYYADVVILDAEKFKAVASFSEPTRLAVGVDYLLVNGIVAIADSEYTGARPGLALSRDDCRLSASCRRQREPN